MFLHHPVGSNNLPQGVPEERLSELTGRIRRKELTKEEEVEIVMGHMRLLLSLAQKWSIRSPHLSDVFVADGLFAMLMAIRQAPAKLRPDKTLTQYIIIRIVTSFKKAVINQQVMKSFGADRKAEQKHKDGYIRKKSPQLRRHNLPEDRKEVEGNKVAKEYLEITNSKLIARLDRADLREIFQLAVKDSWEEAILELKKQGYTLQESAEMLGTNRQTVSKVLAVIEERLRELLRE